MPRSIITRILALSVVLLVVAACGSSAPVGPFGEGREVYANVCSACHGSGGQGGVGPALENVTETFGSCADHQRWITLGSDGWSQEFGATYGDTAKPVEGGMPSHAVTLTADEIAAVAAFERSQYGGMDPDVAVVECGFAEVLDD